MRKLNQVIFVLFTFLYELVKGNYGNIDFNLKTFTTKRCNCGIMQGGSCEQEIFKGDSCIGNCKQGNQWCDISVKICIGDMVGNPDELCPTNNDKVACNILDTETQTINKQLIGDFDFEHSNSLPSRLGYYIEEKFVFVKLMGLHNTGEGVEVQIEPTHIQCFKFNKNQNEHIVTSNYNAKIRIGCPDNFYGEECTVYCRDTPHTTCTKLGERKCRDFHFGTDCKTKCIPNEYYSCHKETGNKECREKYFGRLCNVYCPDALSDSLCLKDGNAICKANFFGPNCDTPCNPTKTEICDDNGRHQCRKHHSRMEDENGISLDECKCLDETFCNVLAANFNPDDYGDSFDLYSLKTSLSKADWAVLIVMILLILCLSSASVFVGFKYYQHRKEKRKGHGVIESQSIESVSI